MVLAVIVFLFVTGLVIGAYYAIALGGINRQIDRRLREVSAGPAVPDASATPDAAIVKRTAQGPLPAIDKLLHGSRAGSGLHRLIEQSGVKTTPSAILMFSAAAAIGVGLLAALFLRQPIFGPIAGAVGAFMPIAFLKHKRSVRLKKFEEQFPEALDVLSRAIRAGHAFQTAMGMAADELPIPVGPELKKTFDQQNFGLPLRDALNDLAERVDILDVRFFVTAVLIQRETGGNLAEILDNLAHVVRERFKIQRQVRVHTAHGRFTGYVLLALPAFLAIALSFLNPDHMSPLFRESLGQTMLICGMVLQAIGYFWIRQVIKIEV
ncbi:MAG TPA: type II secretion system F family protein [Vicinamibacterales bacterium]|nr:type II secretion system F family protein [Vicinamibacterales bacterium]